MAEVVKAKERQKLVKVEEKEEKKKNSKTSTTKKKEERENNSKKNIWERFMIFCNGVKSEAKKVRWTSKKDMVKYSIATIVFMIFCSIFFYLIDTLFALVQSLFN